VDGAHHVRVWQWIRRAIYLVLGVILIADSLQGAFNVVQFCVGLILVGLLSIESIIDYFFTSKTDNATIERLREVIRKKEEDDGQGPAE